MEILDDLHIDQTLTEEEADWELFIGENANYYLPIWKKIKQGKRIHINLMAGIFWVAWAGYRKMYLVYFLLIFTRNLLLKAVPNIFDIEQRYYFLITVLSFLLFALWALFANLIYYKHAIKKINAIKAKKLSQSEQETAIKEAGDIDAVFPVFVGILIFIVISLIENPQILF